MTVSEQREAFVDAPQPRRMELTANAGTEGGPPRGKDEAQLVWFERIEKFHCALSYKHPGLTPPRLRYDNEYMPSYEDLGSFEEGIGSRGAMEVHAEHFPIALHRMGYFRSYGVRDLTVFGNDGSMRIMPFGPGYEGNLPGQREDHASCLDVALACRFREAVKETPFAVFLLHRFGERVDFSLERLIPHLKYTSMMAQLEEEIIIQEEDEEQVPNIQLLHILEWASDTDIMFYIKNGGRVEVNVDDTYQLVKERRAYSYVLEKDPAEYWLFAGGCLAAVNNRRAMRGYVRRMMEARPDWPIFVHRMGSRVDLGLAKVLAAEEGSWDEWVDRGTDRGEEPMPELPFL
jgi:hypothetical protein